MAFLSEFFVVLPGCIQNNSSAPLSRMYEIVSKSATASSLGNQNKLYFKSHNSIIIIKVLLLGAICGLFYPNQIYAIYTLIFSLIIIFIELIAPCIYANTTVFRIKPSAKYFIKCLLYGLGSVPCFMSTTTITGGLCLMVSTVLPLIVISAIEFKRKTQTRLA